AAVADVRRVFNLCAFHAPTATATAVAPAAALIPAAVFLLALHEVLQSFLHCSAQILRLHGELGLHDLVTDFHRCDCGVGLGVAGRVAGTLADWLNTGAENRRRFGWKRPRLFLREEHVGARTATDAKSGR